LLHSGRGDRQMSTRKTQANRGRMAKALKAFLRSVGKKSADGASVSKNPGGSITITPLKRNVAAGFHDDSGFHPLRASYDYSPARAGEKPKKAKARKAPKRKAAPKRRKPAARKKN